MSKNLLLLGCGGSAAAASYSAVAAGYDGTNDAVSMTSGFGYLGSKVALISAWLYWDEASWPAAPERLLTFANAAGPDRLFINTASSGRLSLNGKNAANSAFLVATTATSTYAAQTWHHTLISFDCAASAFHWYVDDADLGLTPTISDDTIEACTRAGVGNAASGVPAWLGGLADVYFAPVYLDLSVEANRRNFIDAAGKPADISAYGSPLLRLDNPISTWHTNTGSGGGLTLTGELTVFASSPSD